MDVVKSNQVTEFYIILDNNKIVLGLSHFASLKVKITGGCWQPFFVSRNSMKHQ